ncbi:4-hydroxyproline epimerase [Spiribacter onubensis]|uniref:4-hydroxyproline epimerase n=1 Tax=Spiribacter onubensis TaxID=3122420 RepID=A0ABV3S9Z8_9GAMM
MARHTFLCVDGHTCGNPVRVVAGGGPRLTGASLSEYRQDFLANHDWIRRGLMFEPRGHDMMSGSILYAPTRSDCDIGVLFIETSGCLPMCGHGTIGTVTTALEEGFVTPREPGKLRLDTPAGVVEVSYERDGRFVDSVSLRNVPAWLEATDLEVEVPGLGPLRCDIAYGGNFYAIFDPQPGFEGLDALGVDDILRLSPEVRRRLNALIEPVHPDDDTIHGVSHVMWTGPARDPAADARNAVFYGDRAIDRSPCGTGTSARMAQLHGRGRLSVGDRFVHESIIGTLFTGEVLGPETIGPRQGIRPGITGWARVTGYNTIFIDDRDPLASGFSVT